jgi:choline dehydrogenase-like flavoprotein
MKVVITMGGAMRWLSKGFERIGEMLAEKPDEKPDVIVIGSGYGGAVAAARFAAAGMRVFVLERGREYRPGEFPTDVSTLPRHLRISRAEADGRFTNVSVASGYAYDSNVEWRDNEFARCFCASNRDAEDCADVDARSRAGRKPHHG